jgi:hypothetical protein
MSSPSSRPPELDNDETLGFYIIAPELEDLTGWDGLAMWLQESVMALRQPAMPLVTPPRRRSPWRAWPAPVLRMPQRLRRTGHGHGRCYLRLRH